MLIRGIEEHAVYWTILHIYTLMDVLINVTIARFKHVARGRCLVSEIVM